MKLFVGKNERQPGYKNLLQQSVKLSIGGLRNPT